MKTKSNKAAFLDISISLITIAALAYFLYYFNSIGMMWSPIVIYSTIGAVVIVIVYDFLRYLIPTAYYKRNHIWVYEHIYKMTSAFAALLSAFAGTVYENYQPHSQYLPSALGMLIIIGFMWYFNKYGLKIWRKA